MSTCRINPTVNGYPHLGHAYLALVNQHAARSTGGQLSIIFDDTQPCWVRAVGREGMNAYAVAWLDDLAWLGIRCDQVFYQSDRRAAFMSFMRERGYTFTETQGDVYPHVPTVVGAPYQYPYDALLTLEKVWQDREAGCDMIIRGDDLRDEYALYQHLWREAWGDPLPEHVYLPRLTAGDGQMGGVSKTEGGHALRRYRELGYSPDDIEVWLRFACLTDPCGMWDWRNVKPHPRLMPFTPYMHKLMADARKERV